MEKKTIKLPEKQFIIRNSLLIDLFENKHIKTVYHLFLATFLGLFINSVATDYLKNDKEIKLGLKLIALSFSNIHLALVAWLGFNFTTCLTFFCFNIWRKIRINLITAKKLQFSWDFTWLIIIGTYYILSFRLASVLVSLFDLAPASAAFLTIEQTRLLMKVHSFVRTNSPKVLNYKPHSDTKLVAPKFSQFLYFLFAPTLLYRESYPRTQNIRWDFIFFRILEIIGVVFYYSLVIERLLNPSIQEFGQRTFTLNEIILTIFENSITGILILLGTFFLVLHSWQNLFSEFLRFGDRLFYLDWWTCTSISSYYRTWNIVVQDWLYAYIYKDMYEMITPNNKFISRLAVLTISAVIHEWILTYMFGFFFPVLFVEFFVFGSILTSFEMPKNAISNILFWYALALGMGISVDLYGIEFYARRNSPIPNATMKDFFVPRFLTCDCIKF